MTKRRATKADLIEHVVETHGVSKVQARKLIDTVLTAVVKSTIKHEMLVLPGFGTFKLSRRKAVETRNPQSGEVMHIPAMTTLAFKPTKGLLDGETSQTSDS